MGSEEIFAIPENWNDMSPWTILGLFLLLVFVIILCCACGALFSLLRERSHRNASEREARGPDGVLQAPIEAGISALKSTVSSTMILLKRKPSNLGNSGSGLASSPRNGSVNGAGKGEQALTVTVESPELGSGSGKEGERVRKKKENGHDVVPFITPRMDPRPKYVADDHSLLKNQISFVRESYIPEVEKKDFSRSNTPGWTYRGSSQQEIDSSTQIHTSRRLSNRALDPSRKRSSSRPGSRAGSKRSSRASSRATSKAGSREHSVQHSPVLQGQSCQAQGQSAGKDGQYLMPRDQSYGNSLGTPAGRSRKTNGMKRSPSHYPDKQTITQPAGRGEEGTEMTSMAGKPLVDPVQKEIIIARLNLLLQNTDLTVDQLVVGLAHAIEDGLTVACIPQSDPLIKRALEKLRDLLQQGHLSNSN